MVDTIGKKLSQARLARGLSIEEAAHETRIRPDKLLALENDDYGRFGSNAYAKGFLQIYGRFLGVDVSNAFVLLEIPKEVTISDYQYLNNAAAVVETKPQRQQPMYRRSRSEKPTVVPLITMLALMVVAAGAYVTYLVDVTTKRLEPGTNKPASAAVTDGTSPAAGTIAGSPESNPVAQPVGQDAVVPAPRTGQPQLQTPVSYPADAQILEEQPAPPAATPEATANPMNELVIEAVKGKKTWVKVRRDGPSPSTFEDYVYPGAKPLTVPGSSFYVEVQDQDAVQIRVNGTPIAYSAPGISIR